MLQRDIDKPRESQASNTREALQALIFGILAMMGRIEEARALQEETNLEVAMLHIEIVWQEPKAAAFLRRLAEFSRLILFDKRGTGMSDTVSHAPPVDERMDDIGAVTDAAGSGQAALLGYSEGGALALVFAASHPERITEVIAYASFARPARAVECGRAIQGANQAIGLHVGLGVCVGLHVGECELRGDDIGGMAVHTAARVADAAAPDEILDRAPSKTWSPVPG